MFNRINSLAVREATTRESANWNRRFGFVLNRIKRSTHVAQNLAAVALALFTLPVVAAVTPGAILGSFNVSESGAATYSIPIAVPPGTAGMEPKVSLNYSARAAMALRGLAGRWVVYPLSPVVPKRLSTTVQRAVYNLMQTTAFA